MKSKKHLIAINQEALGVHICPSDQTSDEGEEEKIIKGTDLGGFPHRSRKIVVVKWCYFSELYKMTYFRKLHQKGFKSEISIVNSIFLKI